MEQVDFKELSIAIDKQLKSFKGYTLVEVDATNEELWDTYLSSFPDGSNPIYKERTEHDCNCCKQFIRSVGNLCAIIDDKLVSVWDVEVGYPYNSVVEGMQELVSIKTVSSLFFTDQRKIGAKQTLATDENGNLIHWDHFFGELPAEVVKPSNYVSVRGKGNTQAQTLLRCIKEISTDSLETILSLINDNMLYRGTEFKESVSSTFDIIKQYNESTNKELFIWSNYKHRAHAFRNSSIGTLAINLSKGEELETSVKKFESVVAPTNYKRSKSLITEKMITSALETVDELELRTALDRRYAAIDDISVNDIRFVDRDVQPLMRDSLKDALFSEAKPKVKKQSTEGEEISIKDFIDNILPSSTKLEVLFEGAQVSNLVSLTAPVDPNSNRLFKWDNGFAWSYNGEVTDSIIKQRVKSAGGNIDAKLRISLSWTNGDDLDIHMNEPDGKHVYYGRKDGKLDVDMNAGGVDSRSPVENIAVNNIKGGVYRIRVHNFTARETIDRGYVLEVEYAGKVTSFHSNTSPKNDIYESAFSFEIKNGEIKFTKVNKNLSSNAVPVEQWGINTETYHKVNTVMLSPNFWNDQEIGNKHLIFMLEDCKNPDKTRGMYNEFLRDDLHEHRKVFEILAQKTKCEESDNQISGLGFSETIPTKVKVKVDNVSMTIKI